MKEHHCTKCCGPNIIEKLGCQCGKMKDGIITVFENKKPKWICRKCRNISEEESRNRYLDIMKS